MSLYVLDAVLWIFGIRGHIPQHDDFRPGPEYIAKWGYHVDASGTVPYSQ